MEKTSSPKGVGEKAVRGLKGWPGSGEKEENYILLGRQAGTLDRTLKDKPRGKKARKENSIKKKTWMAGE